MDIISPPRFGSRKRSWGDDQLDRPFKRTTYSRTRDRPPCAALTQQVHHFPFGANIPLEDEIMTSVNEPQQRDQIQDLSARHALLPIPTPPVANLDTPLPLRTTSSPLATVPPSEVGPTSAAPAQIFLNSNTKRRFAIGPRSNCERCLSGEPGHYGHWL
ncbi:hypothetical protein FRC08_000271 [Ceratobasidium sp. 394]|nr:hypothetical protein FRC08_000271 [Ceratobasidium sp. 394]